MNLRDAAQRIRILHAIAIDMRLANLATFEKVADVARTSQLPQMRTSTMDAFVHCHRSAAEGIESKRSEHVGGIHQNLCRDKGQGADGQHRLRAVDQ